MRMCKTLLSIAELGFPFPTDTTWPCTLHKLFSPKRKIPSNSFSVDLAKLLSGSSSPRGIWHWKGRVGWASAAAGTWSLWQKSKANCGDPSSLHHQEWESLNQPLQEPSWVKIFHTEGSHTFNMYAWFLLSQVLGACQKLLLEASSMSCFSSVSPMAGSEVLWQTGLN